MEKYDIHVCASQKYIGNTSAREGSRRVGDKIHNTLEEIFINGD
jgi:hypothetical protein